MPYNGRVSQVEWERYYANASELLEEDERERAENVWVNVSNPAEPRYLLLAVTHSDLRSYEAVVEPYERRGYVQAMPYGELAYYAKVHKPGLSAEDVDGVVQFYLESDAWPE